jgi:hypothetical protein
MFNFVHPLKCILKNKPFRPIEPLFVLQQLIKITKLHGSLLDLTFSSTPRENKSGHKKTDESSHREWCVSVDFLFPTLLLFA